MLLRKPREPRRMVVVRATMTHGKRRADVVIGNVSSRGLMAKCDRPPARGARVEIRHGGLTIAGEVVWSQHRRFGLRSDEPIELAELFPKRPAAAQPRSLRRFLPPEIRPAAPTPASRPSAPQAIVTPRRSAWRDAIVASIVATVTTSAVQLGLIDIGGAWYLLQSFFAR